MSPRKGFTLISALLVTTLLISIGIAISTIAMRRTVLTTSAYQSSQAFNSADSWLECVTYNDLTLNTIVTGAKSTITCFEGKEIPITQIAPQTLKAQNTNDPSYPCGEATISYSHDTKANLVSYITATGYSSCSTDDVRRVERTLYSTYK